MYEPYQLHNYTDFFERFLTITKGYREITDFGFVYRGAEPKQRYELQRYIFSQGFEVMFFKYAVKEEFRFPFVLQYDGLDITSYFKNEGGTLDNLIYCPTFRYRQKDIEKVQCLSIKPGMYYVINVYFSRAWLYDFIDLSSLVLSSAYEPISIQGDKKIRLTPLVTSLWESKFTGIVKRTYIQGKAIELFAVLLDMIMEMPGEKQTPLVYLSEQDKASLRQVKTGIELNFSNPPSLSELSHSYCLNIRKLTQGFRQMYGTTIYNYVFACRMKRALFCLQNLKLSVAETASQVGYVHQGHFISQFAKYFGYTPGQIKKALSYNANVGTPSKFNIIT